MSDEMKVNPEWLTVADPGYRAFKETGDISHLSPVQLISIKLIKVEGDLAQARERLRLAREALERCLSAIASLPEESLGWGWAEDEQGRSYRWPLRDELKSEIEKALATIDGKENQ